MYAWTVEDPHYTVQDFRGRGLETHARNPMRLRKSNLVPYAADGASSLLVEQFWFNVTKQHNTNFLATIHCWSNQSPEHVP